MQSIFPGARALAAFGRPKVLDQIHCNSLHGHENSHAMNYPLAASAVAECVASLHLIARRANSLHVGCVCNAMQRNAKPPTPEPRCPTSLRSRSARSLVL